MSLIGILVGGGIALVTAAVVSAVKSYRNEIAAKNQEIAKLTQSLSQYSTSYQFEDCDRPLIDSVKQYMSSLRSKGNLSDTLADTELDERKNYFTKITNDIAQRMGVEVNEVNIHNLGNNTFGTAYEKDGRYIIELNEAILIADPDRLLKTVAHELRHLQQFQAITNDKWGFSTQRKAQWMVSWSNYVDLETPESQAEYAAYRYQIIEEDANSFADEVLKF